MNTTFAIKYIIILECIDEGNSFGLPYGDISYAAGWDGTDYTHDINNASIGTDLDYVKKVAKTIKDEGDFNPSIREIVTSFGKSINF